MNDFGRLVQNMTHILDSTHSTMPEHKDRLNFCPCIASSIRFYYEHGFAAEIFFITCSLMQDDTGSYVDIVN